MSPFRIVDHTADIAVVMEGEDEVQLLRTGMSAVYRILTDSDADQVRAQKTVKKRIRLEFANFEELFIDFLNRLVSIADSSGLLPVRMEPRIKSRRAVITVRCICAEPAQVVREVKAATHHNYRIERSSEGLLTKITFDI